MPCPLHFTEEELQSHVKDGEGWNEIQDFWDSVAAYVTRDGWTAHSTYAEALKYFSDLRRIALESMTGKERERFEFQTRWAKDLDAWVSSMQNQLLRRCEKSTSFVKVKRFKPQGLTTVRIKKVELQLFSIATIFYYVLQHALV